MKKFSIEMSGKEPLMMILLKKNFWIRKKIWIRLVILGFFLPTILLLAQFFIGNGKDESAPLSGHYYVDEGFSSAQIRNQNDMRDFLNSSNYRNISIRYTSKSNDANILGEIMNMVKECLGSTTVLWCPDEVKMIDELQNLTGNKIIGDNASRSFSIGVVFETKLSSPPEEIFRYKLRINERDDTSKASLYTGPLANISDDLKIQFRKSDPKWMSVQVCIDQVYINWVTKNKSRSILSIRPMPIPQQHRITPNYFKETIILKYLFYLMIIIIYFIESGFPSSEKQSGMDILMLVNGVKHSINLFSWLINAAICYFIPVFLVALLTTYSIIPSKHAFFEHNNMIVFWLALFLQIIQFISFGYHMSAYSSNPAVSQIFKQTIPFLLIYIDAKTENLYARHIQMYFGIISPTFLISRIINEFIASEVQGDGVGWSNIFEASDSESLPTEGSIGMLIILSFVGIFVNFIVAVYINAIYPGEYGVARHPLFFIQGKKNPEENQRILPSEESNNRKKEFESVPEGIFEPGLQIRGLAKTFVSGIFKKTKNFALQGVSADFYKGQITILLGHNGAGKTTMMNIWSGLSEASGGVTFINGKNIQDEPEIISKNVGFCAQKNIFSPDLTVYQHVLLFGALKSKIKTSEELEDDINNLLSQVNLTDKKNSLPQTLSGGQQRRLCIAIAVIGDANVLIFDEPTSGIDAEKKRQIWDIILKMREQKTIIITTHDMEEANILGDRVAIMHTGKLRSYGSPMFLKNLYGEGRIEVTLSVNPSCTSSNILNEIGITVDLLREEHGKIILTFQLAESVPAVLDKLEDSKKMLGITGISVSNITLDQIFTKVTEDESTGVIFNDEDEITLDKKTTGYSYFMQTLWGYSMKKKTYIMNNPWTSLMIVLYPCMALVFSLLYQSLMSSPNREYSLELYPSSTAFVQSEKESLAEMFKQTILDYGGEKTSILPQSGINMEGALLDAAKVDLGSYNQRMIVSAEFKGSGNDIEAIGFYSGRAVHGIPIVINCLTNTLLKDFANDTKLKIQMSTENFLANEDAVLEEKLRRIPLTVLFITFFLQVFNHYILHPYEEAQSGMKQLQFMTGASKISYWTSMFIFDIIQYSFSILICLGSFIIFYDYPGQQIFHMTEIGVISALFLLFGISILPFIYLVSSFKLSKTMAQIIVGTLPLVLMFMNEFISFIVNPAPGNLPLTILSLVSTYVFELFPQVIFYRGYNLFFKIVFINASRNPALSYFEDDPLMEGLSLTTCMIKLVVLFFLYCSLIFISELHIFDRIFALIRKKDSDMSTEETDGLVEIEKDIILKEINKRVSGIVENDNENVFLAYELKKNYGIKKVIEVVKGVSFRVKQGECFGLLGVNGAGKSTTFRLLTGAEFPDEGVMYTKNFGIRSDRRKYLAEMGYCPQHEVLIDSLSARDHLFLFARLRGIPETEIKSIVEILIQKLNLTVCAAQPSKTYSGGNKRRLQFAMALIGNPSLILMDEPTAGVDPGARKLLWKVLKSCQVRGQSVIFTSHSMEECEILCNRLSIMIKGQLVCVGAAQELKQRFGVGFIINIILKPSQSVCEIQEIKYRIKSSLVCKMIDENSGLLSFHITDPKTTWTRMYATMESLKRDYNSIEDFSVLSSTLEQLFIQFARAAEDKDETTV